MTIFNPDSITLIVWPFKFMLVVEHYRLDLINNDREQGVFDADLFLEKIMN